MLVRKSDRIIISRTDSIGDVVLTLPLAGILKEYMPGCHIIFLGKSYTRPVIDACIHVDEFADWDEISVMAPLQQIKKIQSFNADSIIHVYPRKEIVWLSKRTQIPVRIATAGRWYTMTKCNRLVFFSRKRSLLHESQLNLKLLKPLGIDRYFSQEEIARYFGFRKFQPLPASLGAMVVPGKINVVLHPLSKGSAVEWGLENFNKLAGLLPSSGFMLFVTGTESEGASIRKGIDFSASNILDLTGKLSLGELISFINACDVMIAGSTGPLHIAAACGKKVIGLYSRRRPIHPGRWAPIGKNATYLVSPKKQLKGQLKITPAEVVSHLLLLSAEKVAEKQ